MILWRLYRQAHGTGLDGAGGLHTAGRWHALGTPIVYFGASAAIVLLEKLAHVNPDELPVDLILTRFEGDLSKEEVMPQELDDLSDLAQTRARGERFLEARSACVLLVPSVLVPEEYNLVFNPLHPDASRLQAIEHRSFAFGTGLL
ncbi:MAG: RES family NAD+ phosphorylase [Gammaproteobacteria bacterium]|nr:RES family NAD+ phosphorylase [Gammaproteobacteria bacterium]